MPTEKERLAKIEGHYAAILTLAGHDIRRDGLAGTPARLSRYIREISEARPLPKLTLFEEAGADQMVVERGLTFSSHCEHHVAPFYGTAVIGYLPGPSKRIIGLSKLPRLLLHFAHGLQNQERITRAVAECLFALEGLNPTGVGVLLEATHTCMSARGVRCHGATTRTQCLLGTFSTEPQTRQEFLAAATTRLAA